MGTPATKPVWYHRAVWETYSMVRSRFPYQRASLSAVQTVAGSACTWSSVGRRDPTMRGRPFWRGRRGGGGATRQRIEAQAGNDGGDGPHGIQQVEGGVAPVANDDQRAVWEPAMHESNELACPQRNGLVPAAVPLRRSVLKGPGHSEMGAPTPDRPRESARAA